MKRVLHQEWLEKWLAGEDIEFTHRGSSEFKQFTNSYTLDMFEDATYTFRTPPKLLTIEVERFVIDIIERSDELGDIHTSEIEKYIKGLLAKQDGGS